MNWIRIAVGIMDDPSIGALAEALGVSVPSTTGHVVGVLAKMPTHAKDGDISHIPGSTIERWAMWTGKRGKFAAAFRAHLCTEQEVVRSWEAHNGAAIRESDAARDRMRKAREDRRTRGKSTPNVPEVFAEPFVERSPLTGRDGTGRTNNKKLLTADAVAPAGKGRFPQFPKPVCDAGYDVWLTEMGATNYGQFRRAFGPLFTKPEAERPSALPRDAELVPAIKLYVASITGTTEARFASPKKCAESLTRVVEAMREGGDADARLTLAQFALGTNQRTMFPTRTAA